MVAATAAALSVAAGTPGDRPVAIVQPSIRARGGVYKLDPGRWNHPQAEQAFQWQRCSRTGRGCRNILGANGRAWEPLPADAGHRIRATVRVVVKRYTTVAATRPTPVVGAVARPTVQPADPFIQAAGDIACAPEDEPHTVTTCHQQETAALLSPQAAAILPLGDTQYECGAKSAFGAFDASWGRLKNILHPVVGNHEYQAGPGCPTDAGPYFDYFGAAAGARGDGWYSFDVGAWHLIALNSECTHVACVPGSRQEEWLRHDIASTTQPCVLAYWHEPRFVSTTLAPEPAMLAIWRDLYAAHADVVLNGHIHEYARYAPATPEGAPAPHGIRQFIVGTGGKNFYPETIVRPQSLVDDFSNTTFGVLRLTLHSNGYDWRFEPEAGRSFTDVGSARCNPK